MVMASDARNFKETVDSMLIRPGTHSLIGKTMRERRKDGGEREMAERPLHTYSVTRHSNAAKA